MAKDRKDTKTGDMHGRGRGRPAKYGTDADRKAARAAAARARRAAEREAGVKEVRVKVKAKDAPLTSDIIDLSAVPEHRR